jgi:hypothetical protein
VLGRTYEFLLLVRVYAVGGTGEFKVAAQPDLYKYQRLPVAHDQVYLAKAATIVLLQQHQALPGKKPGRRCFCRDTFVVLVKLHPGSALMILDLLCIF